MAYKRKKNQRRTSMLINQKTTICVLSSFIFIFEIVENYIILSAKREAVFEIIKKNST
jgi:hypothetical protein